MGGMVIMDTVLNLKGVSLALPYYLAGAPSQWDSARVREWKPTREEETKDGGIPFVVKYSLEGSPKASIVGWFVSFH